MKLLSAHISKLTDSAKIDLLTRAVFGDVDDETLKETPGLMRRFSDMDQKLGIIMYGGALAAGVIVLHLIGVPTQLIWGFVSKASVLIPHVVFH